MTYSKERNKRRLRKLEQARQDEVLRKVISEIGQEGCAVLRDVFARLIETPEDQQDAIIRSLTNEQQGLYTRFDLRLTQLAHERGISLN